MIQQLDLFILSIENPCKGICTTNQLGYCICCMRSREERFHWQNFTNEQKKAVLKLCRHRYYRYMKKKKIEEIMVIEETQLSLF